MLSHDLSTVYGEGDIHLNSGSIIKQYTAKLSLHSGGTSVISVKDVINEIILLGKRQKGERYMLQMKI